MSEEVKNLVFFQNIVVFLSIGSGVLVFLVFVFQKQSKKFSMLKWSILPFIFSGFFIDLLLNLYSGKNTVTYFKSLYNIYTFLVALFLLLIFRQLPMESLFKKISTVVLGGFLIIFCAVSLFTRSISFENSYYDVFLRFIILFFVLYYFFWKFNSVEMVPITKESTFWFFTALFIYFGIPLVVIVTQKYLGSVKPIALGYLWQIMNFSTVFFHLLIAKMLWIMKTE